MLCPLWQGTDNYGRMVNPDSFNTKNAGCNSAEDRVMTENFLRPQYMEYVSLDANGFRNPTMFSNNPPTFSEGYQQRGGRVVEGFIDNPSNLQARQTASAARASYNIVGSAGYDYAATNTPYSNGTCGVSGNPNCSGCSARRGSKGLALYEGYQDRQANANFNSRRNLSTVEGFKSRCNSCQAGNNTY